MEKMRELYELYLELGHELFKEEIKKPMELYYLHITHDSSNVTSMSSLNTFDANDMQSHKVGDVMFDEDDIFIPQVLMITMMNVIFLVHLLLGRKLIMIIICLQSMMIIVMKIIL